MNYLELAKEQFDNLMEETLDENRHSLGVGETKDYDIDGVKFTIEVNGFWEKSTWFDYKVTNDKGEVIEEGTEY